MWQDLQRLGELWPLIYMFYDQFRCLTPSLNFLGRAFLYLHSLLVLHRYQSAACSVFNETSSMQCERRALFPAWGACLRCDPRRDWCSVGRQTRTGFAHAGRGKCSRVEAAAQASAARVGAGCLAACTDAHTAAPRLPFSVGPVQTPV